MGLMPPTIDKAKFDADGFLMLRQFLPAGEFEQLKANVDRYIKDVVPGLPDSAAYYQDKDRPETLKQLQQMDVDPFFKSYCSNRRWLDVAEALLGERAEGQAPEWFNKPPLTDHPTPPHQDNYYFKLEPPQILTMWLALDRVDDENGCLRYVRGSHRVPIRPHSTTSVLGFSQGITDYGPVDEALEFPLHLEPNDLAIHHGNLIHRADPNRSPTRHRSAFALVIYGASARVDEAAQAEYREAVRVQQQGKGLKV